MITDHSEAPSCPHGVPGGRSITGKSQDRRRRCTACQDASPAPKPTLRSTLDLIPRVTGQTGTADDVPVVRQYGQVYVEELEACEKHYGRRLLADERELLDPFIGP